MAKGKNKLTAKKGKYRKNEKHAFSKKEWYQILAAPALQKKIPVGWTCCKKPTGTEVLADFLKNRVAEICYADITGQKEDICKKIKLIVDDVHGKTVATNFYGFELDKEAIMEKLKKRHTLIEVYVDVKTLDSHIFRIFAMIVTSRRNNQQKINSYAQSSRVKLVRKKIIEDIVKYASTVKADTFAHEVLTDSINSRLENVASKVIIGAKLQVFKLKTVKRGNIDIKGLAQQAKQVELTNEENPEAQNLLTRQTEDN